MNKRTILLMKRMMEDEKLFDIIEVARLETHPGVEQQQLRDVASVVNMTGLIAYEQKGNYAEIMDLSYYLN